MPSTSPLRATPPVRSRFGALILVIVLLAGVAVALGPLPPDQAFPAFGAAEHLAQHGTLPAGAPAAWCAMLVGGMGLGADPISAAVGAGLLGLVALPLLTVRLLRAGARAESDLPTGASLAALALLLDPELCFAAMEGLPTLIGAALFTAGVDQLLRARWAPQPWLAAGLSLGLLGLSATLDLRAAIGALALIGGLLAEGALRRDPVRRVAPLVGMALVCAAAALSAPALRSDPTAEGAWGLSWLGSHLLAHPALWILVGLRPMAGRPTRRSWGLAMVAAAGLLIPSLFFPKAELQVRHVVLVLPALVVLAAESAMGLGRRFGPARLGLGLGLLVSFGLARGGLHVYDRAAVRAAEVEQARGVGRALANQLPPETRIAVRPAGAIPYFARLEAIPLGPAARAAAPDAILPVEGLLHPVPAIPPIPSGLQAADLDGYRAVVLPFGEEWLCFWLRQGFLEERFPALDAAGG